MVPKTVSIQELQEGALPGPIIGPIERVRRLGECTHNRMLPGLQSRPRQLRRLRQGRRR